MDIATVHNRNVARQLAHVERGTTDEAEGILRIPAWHYTDPERFRLEMEKIFLRVPLFVGLSHEVPEAGDYKTLEVLGKPLLIARQRDGSVRVMLNVCTHRGMLVAPEGSGSRPVFTCPYHGWTFNLDGSLRGIADPHKFGEVERKGLGLTALPCYERAGMIFAVLTPGLEVDFASFLGGMIEDIEAVDFPSFHFYGTRRIEGANWKIAYDGYLEGYHFAAAHPDTIFPRTFSNVMAFDAYGPHLLIGFPQRSILERLAGVPEGELHRHENDGFDFIRLLFPNVSIFVAPEVTQIAQLLPGPTVDRNTTVMYYLHREKLEGEARRKLEEIIDWLWKVVEVEDYGVGLAVQRGLASGAIREVLFGRNERGNQYFHRWVDYYLADCTGPVPAL